MTCPVTRTEIPRALANPTSASAHPGPATVPPAPGPPRGRGAPGSNRPRAGRAVRHERPPPRPGARGPTRTTGSSRRSRAGAPGAETCRRDSSPDANRQGSPAADRLAAIWRRRVDLPMPGSCEQRHGGGHQPAAEDTIDAGQPGRDPALVRVLVRERLRGVRAPRPGERRPPRSSPTAPQPGQRPAHCAELLPALAARKDRPDLAPSPEP